MLVAAALRKMVNDAVEKSSSIIKLRDCNTNWLTEQFLGIDHLRNGPALFFLVKQLEVVFKELRHLLDRFDRLDQKVIILKRSLDLKESFCLCILSHLSLSLPSIDRPTS